MSKSLRNIILGVLCFIVIFILTMTWFYPFSPFSFYKSYSYKLDPLIVDEYVEDLDNLKKAIYKKSKKDTASASTLSALQIFEEDWLLTIDSIRMGEDDIDIILFNVRNTREKLLTLTVQEHYTYEQRSYLLTCIENFLSLEEDIANIKKDTFESRGTLKTVYYNLHMDFYSIFNQFKDFYEITQIDNQ